MARARPAIHELASFLGRSAALFEERMLGVAATLVDDRRSREKALDGLAEVLGETMALADLYGRRRVFLEVDAVERTAYSTPPTFLDSWPVTSFAGTPLFPRVTFAEALKDLVGREPRLAPNAELVAELYSTRHAFALARSSELQITERVQKALADLVEQGVTQKKAEAVLQEIGPWTRAYADTVYRTNLNTAYTAGRFQQAADPDVAAVMPAFERFSVRDSNARPNHRAAHGLIAATTDPIWDTAATPSGYGCRCNMRLVSRFELRRRGLLTDAGVVVPFLPPTFGGYHPDKNFEMGRPDRRMYLGAA